MKRHHFIVSVVGNLNRKSAELALLLAFSKRNPDGCSFHLSYKNPFPKRNEKKQANP